MYLHSDQFRPNALLGWLGPKDLSLYFLVGVLAAGIRNDFPTGIVLSIAKYDFDSVPDKL